MVIRNILEEDIEACANLFSKVFSSEPWNEPWEINSATERLMHFYHSKGFIGLLAESENITGFVLGNTEPFHFGSMFYLREMCTANDMQNKGVGGQILNALEIELSKNKIHSLYLTTDRRIPAANFYQKNGFKLNETMGFYARRVNS